MSNRADSGFHAPKEWLVTDGRGGFAMGTHEGLRTRKYHGFYLGIPGRTEAAFLTDLALSVGDQNLWPHRYRSGMDPAGPGFRYVPSSSGPEWEWVLNEPTGTLHFAVRAQRLRGIELQWTWHSPAFRRVPLELKVRPFFALRGLHSVGGQSWKIETVSHNGIRVLADSEQAPLREAVYALLSGKWTWEALPYWYREFYYTEEVERGYEGEENLYSAGHWNVVLKDGERARMLVSDDPEILARPQPARRRSSARGEPRVPVLDFVLHEPAGVVAGYPWFGEWGRDTFISLPGLAIRWLASGGESHEVASWVDEVLTRWGAWIQLTGMLPNLIEKNGAHQWESADATLWWCHALASLWAFGAAGVQEFQGLDRRYKPLLDRAIESIATGRHVFLRPGGHSKHGMLEVTEPHATWMDARIEGCAVTPRTGVLPEINSLWFQALCLQALWSESQPDSADGRNLEGLGLAILDHRPSPDSGESDRPNFVFKHSLPLAPSFVLAQAQRNSTTRREIQRRLERDFNDALEFWTPVGLRSLRPSSRAYLARCVGTQADRDSAYHRGTAWAWLGGHFEMLKERGAMKHEETLSLSVTDQMPIEGHVPEIFDGNEPFTPRGAPAQAWSLACLEEARARKRLRVDAKVTEILSRRWLGKEERRSRRKIPRSANAPDKEL